MIDALSASIVHTRDAMTRLIHFFYDHLDRFERWFDDRFGWFFTNGMKGHRSKSSHTFKA